MKINFLKLIPFLTIILVISGPIAAQEQTALAAIKPEIPVRDYIVIKPGDTLDVRYIQPPSRDMPYGDSVWLQDKIIVMKNNKRVEIYPGEIQGYCYQGIYRESLSWIKDMNTSPWTFDKKFCKRIVTGAIPVYIYYDIVPSRYDASERIVNTKMKFTQKDKLMDVMFLNFNKGVSKIVSAYPELAEKVRGGAYKREEFAKIMEEYNEWATSHK